MDGIIELLKITLVFCHLQVQVQCVQAEEKTNKWLPVPLKLETGWEDNITKLVDR